MNKPWETRGLKYNVIVNMASQIDRFNPYVDISAYFILSNKLFSHQVLAALDTEKCVTKVCSPYCLFTIYNSDFVVFCYFLT